MRWPTASAGSWPRRSPTRSRPSWSSCRRAGMERWLSQRLSHVLGAGPDGDGVCAAVAFRSPGSLVAEVTGTRDDDPWAPDALAWPLLDVVDAVLDEPWAATLARHLGHGLGGAEADLRMGRRFSVARRLARLFASYAGQRPSLVADWSAGRDTDGCGRPLAADLAWQPELWRRLTARVDGPSPLERQAETVARLREDPEAYDLPVRLSLFGHTRLSVTEVELLDALAAERDVHLWLPHPSPALWEALTGPGGAVDRATDDSHQRVRHPLLSSLGRDTRELQRGLSAAAIATDEELPLPALPATLLGWLQSDLAADLPRPEERVLADGDRSVQVHACHGVARQVDVLREVLLGLLADDPTLEPRDVLVMCPDIETYAPLIEAGFGLGDVVGASGHPAHRLRVRLADRALGQTNPLLGVATAAARPGRWPGRRRHRCSTWPRGAGAPSVRLQRRRPRPARHLGARVRGAVGLRRRAPHRVRPGRLRREHLGVRARPAAHRRRALRRLLGLARPRAPARRRRQRAGRPGRPADRVRRAAARGHRPADRHPSAGRLAGGAGRRGGLADRGGRRATAGSRGRSSASSAGCAVRASDLGHVDLRLPDVRALLSDRLAGRPTRANFRTGTLTVCTMVPMRSVPHRVVCLLGLDDGVFPRQGAVDGDDVLARDPMTGERDAAQRGPPAAPRRDPGRDRDPGHHLHRRQRGVRAAAATRRTARGAARRPRRHGVHRRRPVRSPTRSPSTTRCSPSTPRTSRPDGLLPGETFSFDPAARGGRPRGRRPRTPQVPVPRRARCRPRRRRTCRLADLVRFWATR